MSAVVAPSRAFRRLVHPRRDNPLARPRRVDALRDLEAVTKAWKNLRKHWEGGWTKRADARVELERAADALLESAAMPAVFLGAGRAPDFDVDVFAAAERMLNASASLVPLVGERFGAAAALRVKVRSLDWSVASGREQQTWWWMLAEAKLNHPNVTDVGWQAVRAACCRADETSYARARDEALGLRLARTEAIKRVPIDFAFPSEHAWAREDMTAILASADFSKLTYLAAPLFASVVDEGLCTEFLERCGSRQAIATLRYACDLVAGMPVDQATRVLLLQTSVSLALKTYDHLELQKLACALTSILSEPMALGVAKYMRHPRFARHLIGYFEQHAVLARVALEVEARGKSMAADAARHLIAGHDRAAEPDVTFVPSDMPALLRVPPWAKRPARSVLALERLPYVETISWGAGERERISQLPAIAHTNAQIRDISAAELVEFDALPDTQKYVDVWPRWNNKQWTVLELPDDRRLALWGRGRARTYHRPPCFMLARYGEQTLDGLYARDPFDTHDDRMLVSCFRVDSPRTALVCARLLARRRTWRVRAKAWLREHAEPAAMGLVPVAFGREGRARRTAKRALRFLAMERPEVVRQVAERYGDIALEATLAFAFGDPLGRIDVRGHAPRWLRVAALPRVLTRGGHALPREAVGTIVDVLRARGTDIPYAGIAVLREELDLRSLADLAWSLFLTWVLHGRKRIHEWMALSLAAFADDRVVSRLSPYARDWAHADPLGCVTLVDVLAAIGTEAAVLELNAIADVARPSHLIDAVTEVLGPRSTPLAHLGLDDRGEATLTLGGRVMRVELDESLVPHVVLDDGRRLQQVPRARKGEDPRLAEIAATRFKRLRYEAKIVAKRALRRLESDMVTGRRYEMTDLETRFTHHPLLRHAARRLVWGAFSGPSLVSTFRLVEDGSYGDDRDLPVSLDPGALFGVVHPIDLDPAALSRWGMLFADYELLQPFEQLGRLTFTGSAAEAAEIFKSMQGRMVEARSLLSTLEALGWVRPAGKRVSSASRPVRRVAPHGYAGLTFGPGISLDQVRTAPPQKLGIVALGGGATLETLDRIELSEIVRATLSLST